MLVVYSDNKFLHQQRHYMVDIYCKYEQVVRLIHEGEYFAINRSRQYGKTTMIQTVTANLRQKEVIELKLWRGPQYHEKGLRQFSDYLDFQGLKQGYLLIFDFTRNKSYKQEELSIEDKSVFVVWV